MRLGAQVAAPPHFLVVEWWCLTTTLSVKLTDLRLTTVRFDEGVREEKKRTWSKSMAFSFFLYI